MSVSAALCSAKLRDGSQCRLVATVGDLCAHHSQLAEELGGESVVNGDHTKRRNARERVPVIAESEPFELAARSSSSPSPVRPALALPAAEEVETMRRVLLEAATSTTRETWATCSCPECGKGFRQEISVPITGLGSRPSRRCFARGSGGVGGADVVEPTMRTSVDEVKDLSWDELNLVFAMSYASEIRQWSIAVTTRFVRSSRRGSRTREQRSRVRSPRSADLARDLIDLTPRPERLPLPFAHARTREPDGYPTPSSRSPGWGPVAGRAR
jgi:hypothetical protein